MRLRGCMPGVDGGAWGAHASALITGNRDGREVAGWASSAYFPFSAFEFIALAGRLLLLVGCSYSPCRS